MLYDNGPRMPSLQRPQRPTTGVFAPRPTNTPFEMPNFSRPLYQAGQASPQQAQPSPQYQNPMYGRPPASIGGWGGQSPWQQQGSQQPSQGPQWLRRQGAPRRRPMYGMGYGGMQTIGEMQQPYAQVGLPPGFQSPTQRPYQNPYMR